MRFAQADGFSTVKTRLFTMPSRIVMATLALVLAGGIVGCSSAGTASSSSNTEPASSSAEQENAEDSTVQTTKIDESLYDLEYTKRDKDASYDESSAARIELNGASATGTGDGVSISGSTLTIESEGVYVLTGELVDGQVVVNAPEDAKVQLVLSGASLSHASGPAIYVQQADKCFITLAEATTNVVSDGSSYLLEGNDSEPDAAIFSTCDLTIQGEGALQVNASYNDGVKTKDDLVITGGAITVTAKSDGLVGKDSVKIADGALSVQAGEGDGVKSSKDTDASKGFVSIDGGTLNITAGDKGIKAVTYLRIAGGVVDVSCEDDALHSDGCGRIADGTLQLNAGDDGFHVEYELVIDDGNVDISKSYEGLEGQTIAVNGGNVHIVASDDGINASSANSGSEQMDMAGSNDGALNQGQPLGGGQGVMELPDGEAPELPNESNAPSAAAPEGEMAPNGSSPDRMGRPFGDDDSSSGASADGSSSASAPDGFGMRGGFGGGMGNMMDSDENCVITFNGGTTEVVADGDGIDSNGSIVLNGGVVYVSGPTSSGNGALDCGTSITANGGTLIAVGSAGMAEGFTDGAQAFGQVSLQGSAGDEVQVKDASGNLIAMYAPVKSFQNVVVTAEGMTDGQSYTVSAGSSSTDFTATTEGSSNMGFGGGFGGNSNEGGMQGRDGMQGQRQGGARNGNGKDMRGQIGSQTAQV